MSAVGACFEIVAATPADHERIEAFRREHFYRYEPINASLGVTAGHRCTDRVLPLESLHEGLSLLAVATDDPGRIVGVCLSGEDVPDRGFHLTFTDECDRFKKLFTCVMDVHAAADVFAKTGASRALEIYSLAVAPASRRAGVGRALVEHTVQRVAAPRGFPLVTVTCSSVHTASIARGLGMSCVYTLRYDQYLDEQGVPVFAPPAPHDVISVYVLSIPAATASSAALEPGRGL